MPGYHVWDSWFVMSEDGRVADVHGYRVLVALTRPVGASSGEGERIAYFYSKDCVHYRVGGFLFEKPLYADVREWSGSTILRADGHLQSFYTIVTGVQNEGVWQTAQRFATAIQALSVAGQGDAQRLVVSAPMYHALIAEPDGVFYENLKQAGQREALSPTRHNYGSDDQAENFCFRDPKCYRHEPSGKAYLLFEGNTGPRFCPAGSVRREYIGSSEFEPDYAPSPDDLKANGCVGVLELTNPEYTFGTFLQPWLATNLVTDEIERINLVLRAPRTTELSRWRTRNA